MPQSETRTNVGTGLRGYIQLYVQLYRYTEIYKSSYKCHMIGH